MSSVVHPNGLPLILLTGGTGYIGGRLLRALEASGRRVRCLARRPEFLQARVGPVTEIVAGDCLESSTLGPAMAEVHMAYYLVHSMGSPRDFEEDDRKAAKNFITAACQAGVQRIVYLGGLGEPSSELSSHLRSRQEVGEILRSTNVPVVEFRASIILGSGSISFEMIRALVERLPVMICPRWVATPAQPIAIEDVVAYLLEALSRYRRIRAGFFKSAAPIRVSLRRRSCVNQPRTAPLDDFCTCADSKVVQSVAGARDACLRACGAQARGQPPTSDGRA